VVVHAESTSNSSNTMVLGGLYASNNTAGTKLFRCLGFFVQWSVHAVSSQQPCFFFACLRIDRPPGEQGGGLFLSLDQDARLPSSVALVKSSFNLNSATGGGGGAFVECTGGDMNVTLSDLNTSSNSAGDVTDASVCVL
jgi:hypothetical protein